MTMPSDLARLMDLKYAAIGKQADAALLAAQGSNTANMAQGRSLDSNLGSQLLGSQAAMRQADAASSNVEGLNNSRAYENDRTAAQTQGLQQLLGLKTTVEDPNANAGPLSFGSPPPASSNMSFGAPPTASSGLSFGGASSAASPARKRPGSTSLNIQTPTIDIVRGTTRTTVPIQGFAKGTARVPGKGDGTKDTVNAKLAPGEAVLNKPAAEGMGRGLIAALNKLGAQKMGMV